MKIISGGQTGADQGGLEAGRELGLETGGWAPYGWKTEDGPQEALLRSYGLKLCLEPGYPARTKRNIMDADLTIIFGRLDSPGSKLTHNLCIEHRKHFAVNPLPNMLRSLIEKHNVGILNVAGNRESKSPGLQTYVRRLLVEALKSNTVKQEGSTTSFENLERQWKAAEQLNNKLTPQLYNKAKELGVTIVQIHDSFEFGGLLENQSKLLAWMKKKLKEDTNGPNLT